jgi:hypothetical protein
MKKQQLLVIYLLRLKAIILRHPPKGGRATKQHNR